MLRLGTRRSSPTSEWRASFEEFLLHAIAVFLEPIIVPATIVASVKQIKPFEDVMGEWVSTLSFA